MQSITAFFAPQQKHLGLTELAGGKAEESHSGHWVSAAKRIDVIHE